MVFGFLFSAVAAYMAGVVGSSNNPISGVTIATILFTSILLLALLGTGSGVGAASAIMVGAVVCCAAAIGGDNLQDLKAGQLVGATPWKQQIMQIVGTVSSAIVLGLVLDILHTAYLVCKTRTVTLAAAAANWKLGGAVWRRPPERFHHLKTLLPPWES